MHGLQEKQDIKSVLLIEDNYDLAMELALYLKDAGLTTISTPSLEDAFDILHGPELPDAAVLDVNLNGTLVFPIADELTKLGIPFLFATGYSSDVIPPRFADRVFIEKPLDTRKILDAISSCFVAAGKPHRQSNLILSALNELELAQITPSLETVELSQGQVLENQNDQITSVYFVENGVLSLIAVAPDGTNVEAGLIGREGLTGLGLLDGDWQTPFKLVVQSSGSAKLIAVDEFLRLMPHAPRLRSYASSFTRSLAIQTAYTALANAQYKIEERLARWLVMLSDRLNSQVLDITHIYLSIMLGVRRSGVTNALHVLEGDKLIRSVRGKVVVVNRDGLIAKAQGSYGIPEREYARLMGFDLRGSLSVPSSPGASLPQYKANPDRLNTERSVLG